jgi:hypothetical protein
MLPFMTTIDLGRKVRQLDNDVQAIYEMLAGISATQHRQCNRLEEIAAEQVTQRGTLEKITAEQVTQRGTLEKITAEQVTQRGTLEEILHLLRNGQAAGGEGIRGQTSN